MKFQKGISFFLPLKRLFSNSKPLSLVWLEPGTFLMGSSGKKSAYRHGYEKPFKATLSRGFWLGQYVVTQNQWQAIMQENPSKYQPCPNCPIESVSRANALAFCHGLNEMFIEDLPESYEFSLPTEMQWEYACRAGTQAKYYNGDDALNLSNIAWHNENSLGQPYPVGKKEPNAWGFYDMLGNVWEWCYDFASPYPSKSAIDWVGTKDKSTGVFRGGSCRSSVDSDMLTCSTRGYSWEDVQASHLGFRLSLRTLSQ